MHKILLTISFLLMLSTVSGIQPAGAQENVKDTGDSTKVMFPSPGDVQDDIILFQQLRPFYDRETRMPEYYTLRINTRNYVINWSKKKPEMTDGDDYEHIRLRVGGLYDEIDKIYATEYKNDLILVYEAVDFVGAEGASHVARVQHRGKKKKIVWTTAVEGFNIGEPIIRDHYIYVTSLGAVGKIDLEYKGKYMWQHIDLYDEDSSDYTMFLAPEIEENRVIFYGMRLDRRIHTRLEINDTTGEVINNLLFTTQMRNAWVKARADAKAKAELEAKAKAEAVAKVKADMRSKKAKEQAKAMEKIEN